MKNIIYTIIAIFIFFTPVLGDDSGWQKRASDGWPIFNKHHDHHDNNEFIPNNSADDFFENPNYYVNEEKKYILFDDHN